MVKQNQNTKSTLKTWLFNKPAKFAIWFSIIGIILFGISYIPGIEKIQAITPISITIFLVTIICLTRNLIKQLPYKNINHADFVALTNGYKLTSIILFAGWITFTFFMNKCKPSQIFVQDATINNALLGNGYIIIPKALFTTLEIIWLVIAAYLLGLWISNIYVKYKRAKDTGLFGWKVILSMPFTFIMSWMPGYLTTDNHQTPSLTIKSNWYSKFNKWVVLNNNNTLFMFLLLFVFSNVLISSHPSTILFPLILFAVYMLWKTVAKNNFSKHLNRGYIWLAIILNISMLIMFIKNMFPYLYIIISGIITHH